MSKATTDQTTKTTEYSPVCIYFNDDTITHVFSELLEARGVRTCILSEAQQITPNVKIITEPCFFPLLDETSRHNCLIVGNKDVVNELPVLALTRPLTEEKIEEALSKFLKV